MVCLRLVFGWPCLFLSNVRTNHVTHHMIHFIMWSKILHLKNCDLWKISIFWNFYHNFMVLKMKKFARNSNLNSEYFSSFRCKVRGRKNASGKYEIWLWLRISPNAHRSMFNSHIRFQTGFLSDFSEHFKKFAENVRVPVNINEYGWTPTGKFRKLSF